MSTDSQGSPPQPPPLGYYSAQPQRPGMSTGAKIALGVIIGCCVAMGGCLACVTFIFDNSMRTLNTNSVRAPSAASEATPSFPPAVTSGQYDALKEGMTYDAVVKMLGTRYEVKYESKSKAGSSGVYQWGNANDGFILLQFQNGKLYSKSQVSLKY